jgi:hypothetical protein
MPNTVQNLRVINPSLPSHRFTDDFLTQLATSCTDLRSLDISDNQQITTQGIYDIATKCTNIENISLEGCENVNDSTIGTLVKECKKLCKINLNRCWYITGKRNIHFQVEIFN